MARTAKTTTKEKKSTKTESVIYSNGSPIRVYTLESHGKDFDKLAEQFATKFGYEKRD